MACCGGDKHRVLLQEHVDTYMNLHGGDGTVPYPPDPTPAWETRRMGLLVTELGETGARTGRGRKMTTSVLELWSCGCRGDFPEKMCNRQSVIKAWGVEMWDGDGDLVVIRK